MAAPTVYDSVKQKLYRSKHRDRINAKQKAARDLMRPQLNARTRELRSQRRSYEAAKSKRYYEARCKLLIELKSKPCTDCHLTFPSYVMDFDHVRGEKLFGIAHGMHNHTLDRVLVEIAKCDLVCANCHRIRTHTR